MENDDEEYFSYITRIAHEVWRWPDEMKTRRATVFYDELKHISEPGGLVAVYNKRKERFKDGD